MSLIALMYINSVSVCIKESVNLFVQANHRSIIQQRLQQMHDSIVSEMDSTNKFFKNDGHEVL